MSFKRFEDGTRVITSIDPKANDWAEEVKPTRKAGVTGTVREYHDSHGLCYRVEHDDGGSSYYNHDELRELEKYKTGTKLVSGGVRGVVVPNYKFPGDICVDWENGLRSSYDAEFLDEIAEIVT